MRKWLKAFVILLIGLMPCSGIGYMVGGKNCIVESPYAGMFIMNTGDNFFPLTLFSVFLIGVWSFPLLSHVVYEIWSFFGEEDDCVGGDHIIWVDGKMHHIKNLDEIKVLPGTGSKERGHRWGSIAEVILLCVGLFVFLCIWFSEFLEFLGFFIFSISYWSAVLILYPKILPLIPIIKKGAWLFIVFDLLLGDIWLFFLLL